MTAAAYKGPLASANNLTGITWAAVTLVSPTAKVFTHNYGQGPKSVQLFDQVSGAPVEKDIVAVTGTANAITLTPASNASVNVRMEWDSDPARTNGVPPVNFV
jgi:hypothetical protein